MISKLVAFVLALALVWAGLTTQAQAVSLPSGADLNVAVEPVEPSAPALDQQPNVHPPFDDPASPTQAEPLADLTALVLALHPALVSIFTMSRPSAYTVVGRHPPFLDGLQRPPSRATAIA